MLGQLLAQVSHHVERVIASHLNEKKCAITWPRVVITWECEAGVPGDLAQRARVCASHVQAGVGVAQDEHCFHIAFDKGYSGILLLSLYCFVC